MASGQEIGPGRLGRRYMVLPARTSSPGQLHTGSKRHIREVKACHNGTCGTDGSTVFSNGNAWFPFKKQGPQPLYPTLTRSHTDFCTGKSVQDTGPIRARSLSRSCESYLARSCTKCHNIPGECCKLAARSGEKLGAPASCEISR